MPALPGPGIPGPAFLEVRRGFRNNNVLFWSLTRGKEGIMRGKACIGGLILVAALVAMFWISKAGAETTVCTEITSLPYTISTQGVYCLKANFEVNMVAGNAIEIATNNVVIDLNGHKIGNLAAGETNGANGIFASERRNITIRNGTLRGFQNGIWLDDSSIPSTYSQGHIIEDIRADFNTLIGIRVHGLGSIIRNNIVIRTGRTYITNSYAYGIMVLGYGNSVINNDVHETKEAGPGVARGIYAVHAAGTVIDNNRIGNAGLGTGTSYGIFIDASTNVLVTNNKITRMGYGIYFDGSSTGAYMNSLVYGATTAFTGGTAAGSTNYAY